MVLIQPRSGLVGFASLVLDDCLFLGGIGIYTRPEGGYRLTYPTRKSNGSSHSLYHPINKHLANAIDQAITSKFEIVR